MKEFDLEKAKAGAKVCTRDGREARIICFNKRGNYPIVAIVTLSNDEEVCNVYCSNGMYLRSQIKCNADLMLAGEKKEGWVNIYGNGCCGKTYATKEEAISKKGMVGIVDVKTVHIEWEE